LFATFSKAGYVTEKAKVKVQSPKFIELSLNR
jgi:hypothetical protein